VKFLKHYSLPRCTDAADQSSVASPGFGARGHKTKRVFYWIGNHMGSNVRVCAALE